MEYASPPKAKLHNWPFPDGPTHRLYYVDFAWPFKPQGIYGFIYN